MEYGEIRVGEILEHRYEILEEIGRGGMGIVFKAKDLKIDRDIAIKIMHPGMPAFQKIFSELHVMDDEQQWKIVISFLYNEKKVLSRLRSSAFPTILDIFLNDDYIALVMEYIRGKTLYEYFQEKSGKGAYEIRQITYLILEAIEYLHSLKEPIIYGDMKPGNIIIQEGGRLKLLDFGISQIEHIGGGILKGIGSSDFASPEQRNGHTANRESDIYAIGKMLDYMLNQGDVSKLSSRRERKSRKELAEIAKICMRQVIGRRFESCLEVKLALDSLGMRESCMDINQLRRFIFSMGLGLGFLIIGVTLFFVANNLENRYYDNLLNSISGLEASDKVSRLVEAISIKPEESAAYMEILRIYERQGSFNKEENNRFIKLYEKNEAKLSSDDSKFKKLNEKAGLIYFNYYMKNERDSSLRLRIDKAYGFFKKNIEKEGKKVDTVSLQYFTACDFYRKYILNLSDSKEAGKKEYIQLFDEFENTCRNTEKDSDRIRILRLSFLLLIDLKDVMVESGIDKTCIAEIAEKIFNYTKRSVAVSKSDVEVKKEIIDDYNELKAFFSF